MTRPILYLSGPMTGLPENNYPAFNAAAAQLRAAGYEVVNPAELGLPDGLPWISYMRAALAAMVTTADAVATLPGWYTSRGASAEVLLALRLGWESFAVAHWLAAAEVQTGAPA